MRRLMLLALLALALPTAALATTISFDTGLVDVGQSQFFYTFDCNPHPACINAIVIGPEYTITLSNGGVASVNGDSTFVGGTLTVTNTVTGATLFQNSVETGEIGFSIFISALISGSLEPNATIKRGGFTFLIGGTIDNPQSFAVVNATLVPEASAFEGLLLGAFMLGLVEMTRRKLRLGT